LTHLRSIQRKSGGETGFPFDVPVIRALTELSFDTPVTFFVGENGSGKSTVLEAIALSARLPTVGSAPASDDETLEAQRAFAKTLKLVWNQKRRAGFFLRAEDFFGFTKQLTTLRSEMQQRLAHLEAEYRERSEYAKRLAQGPAAGSLADMERRYGVDLDAHSHGQSFLKLFQSRFAPGGLYLLDEPEAPLSPQSQLALMTMIADMVAQNAQFVVATHSPILLAYPGARIYSFDGGTIQSVEYGELEHVALTRDFLNAPQRYLRHLRSSQEEL
jgi:predicted ATPase